MPPISIACSTPSTRPSPMAWAWASPSAARSSRPMADDSWQRRTRHAALSFASRCRLAAGRSLRRAAAQSNSARRCLQGRNTCQTRLESGWRDRRRTVAAPRRGLSGTPFTPAILLSAWGGGLGPGLLAVGLSLAAMDYYIIEPRHAFWPIKLDDVWYLVVFTTSALFVAWVTGTQRRTEAALQGAHGELTARIKDLARANQRLEAEVAERRRVEAEARKQASLLDLTHDPVFARDL